MGGALGMCGDEYVQHSEIGLDISVSLTRSRQILDQSSTNPQLQPSPGVYIQCNTYLGSGESNLYRFS